MLRAINDILKSSISKFSSFYSMAKSRHKLPLSNFNFSVSLKFVTASYVIFSLSMVQAMEIFMITYKHVTKPRETEKLKLFIVYL